MPAGDQNGILGDFAIYRVPLWSLNAALVTFSLTFSSLIAFLQVTWPSGHEHFIKYNCNWGLQSVVVI